VYRVVSRVLAAAVACTLAGVLGAGTLGLSTSMPTTGLDLREGAAGRVQVDVPEPGTVATFHVTARPIADRPTGLALVVEHGAVLGASGAAAARAAAREVVLTLTDDTGAVLASGSPGELRGTVVDLGVADDAAPVVVHGRASLRADGTGAPAGTERSDGAAPADGATLALDVRVAVSDEARTLGTDGTGTDALVAVAAGGSSVRHRDVPVRADRRSAADATRAPAGRVA
jgi:hypothetical protein